MTHLVVVHIEQNGTLGPIDVFVCYTSVIRVDLESQFDEHRRVKFIPQQGQLDASIQSPQDSHVKALDWPIPLVIFIDYVFLELRIDLTHDINKNISKLQDDFLTWRELCM